jgi:hypothetical protein
MKTGAFARRNGLALLLAVGTVAGNPGCGAAFAAVPQPISYQGQLSRTGFGKLTRGVYTIETRLWDNRTGGQVLWGQAYPVTVDTNGVFNVNLGDGGGATTPTPVYSTLAPALDGGDRFLGITVVQTPSGSVSNPQEMTPRMQLVSSPYALRTAMADVAVNYQGMPPSQLATMPAPPPPSPNARPVLGYDGTNYVTSQLVYNSASDSVVAGQPLQIPGILSALGGVQSRISPRTSANGIVLGDNVNFMSPGPSLGWDDQQTARADCLLVVPWYSDTNYPSVTILNLGSAAQTLSLTLYSGPRSPSGISRGYTVMPIPAGWSFQPRVWRGGINAWFKPSGNNPGLVYFWQ